MGKGSERKKRQKAQHIFDYEIKPGLDTVEGKMSTLIDPIMELKFSEGKEKIFSVQGRLQQHDAKKKATTALGQIKADTIATRPPYGYYIIIGSGAAAMTNHTTLRQTDAGKARLADPTVPNNPPPLPVVHLGFQDPWRHYHAHGMGQPPYLLRMPGYHKPVALDAPTIRTGLNSRVFAQSTKDELDLLVDEFETYIVSGWATLIETKSQRIDPEGEAAKALTDLGVGKSKLDKILQQPYPETYPPYRILVVIEPGNLRFIYAYKIDICSGAGTANIKPREYTETDLPKVWKEADTKPWMPPEKWGKSHKSRSIVNGMDGLTEQTPWGSTQRVCVYGDGGIGLNQIERAHDVGNYIDWFSRNTHHNNTFNLKRNDTVLRKDPLGGFMAAGDTGEGIRKPDGSFDTTFQLYPGSPKWRIAFFTKVNAKGLQENASKLVIPNQANDQSLISNYFDQPGDKQQGRKLNDKGYFQFSDEYKTNKDTKACYENSDEGKAYTRMILCIGQVNDVPGTASKLTDGFTLNPIDFKGRMVGLQTNDGHIRVLGGASVVFPGFDDKDPYKKMEKYRTSLPVSAVPPGFILCGSNIAAANGFFDDQPDNNVNTASQGNLEEIFKKKIDPISAGLLAQWIIEGRMFPSNGFPDRKTLQEFLLDKVAQSRVVFHADWAIVVTDDLQLDYGAAKKWT